MTHNRATQAYLKEYCDPKCERDFAVLLDGPWGAGKTWFIKQFLKDYPKHLYVSLNGMSDVRQIGQEIYVQLHPFINSKGMRIAGAILKSGLKVALKYDYDGDGKDDVTANISVPDLDLMKELGQAKDRLLVFDDFERCDIPAPQILGYINSFVEHDGLKTIILANEKEVPSRDSNGRYAEIKEKVIGQTLRIASSADTAYDSFLEGVAEKTARDYLTKHKNTVLDVHASSDTANLRILKHALWDYERVAKHFAPEHWLNESAMSQLLSVLLVLSIEHRAGHLKDGAAVKRLLDVHGRALLSHVREENSPEDVVAERYSYIDFGDAVLDFVTLSRAIIDGYVDKTEVCAALDHSHYFATSAKNPQTLLVRARSIYNLTDEAANEIATEFMAAFDRGAFTMKSDVMQAFDLLIDYTKIRLIKFSMPSAINMAKRYVRNLSAIPSNFQFDTRNIDELEADGQFQFFEKGGPEFREILDYYRAAEFKALEARFADEARDLLISVAEGQTDKLDQVMTGHMRALPIFAKLPPKEFVSTLHKLNVGVQSRLIRELRERHLRDHDEVLSAEIPWLLKLRDCMQREAKRAGPLTKLRFRALIKDYLDPVIKRGSGL
ncbi:KAP family NTPase [Novosphingobium sp. 1949]|uniref:KAP family NTPase n=1 Tax=Novosphingobium organovorum TaxID=2930092 RepID=A0ABT0BGK1_9SPHN|nr:P-loop NTPase fold protein [Novosphingobium organovorum]MCJ2184088.1 KAP family NTPase [Novosphingobium organovorum]